MGKTGTMHGDGARRHCPVCTTALTLGYGITEDFYTQPTGWKLSSLLVQEYS